MLKDLNEVNILINVFNIFQNVRSGQFNEFIIINFILSSGTMALLALSFLTPYFYYIPQSTLAAVLVTAVVFMIDYKIIIILWRGSSKYFC